MRVLSRASANIARIAATETSEVPDATGAPFNSVAADPNAPLPDHPAASKRKNATSFSGPHAGLSWDLSEVRLVFQRLSGRAHLR